MTESKWTQSDLVLSEGSNFIFRADGSKVAKCYNGKVEIKDVNWQDFKDVRVE